LTNNAQKEIVRPDIENTSDINDKIKTILENIDVTTDKINQTVDKVDVTADKIVIENTKKNSISKTTDDLSGYLPIKFQSIKKDEKNDYYIQIASYRLRKENVYYIECFGDFFIAEYKNKYGKNFENNPKVAYKRVEGKKYLTLLLGPFDYNTAESYISNVYVLAEDAFMVSQNVFEEYR